MDELVLAIQTIQGDQSQDAMRNWTPKEEHCKTDQKKTTATGEDEAEQSLWLALLAGKVEALGQSSQSKCES